MISEALQRPIGPLAAWQWGLVIGGGYIGYRILTGQGAFPSGGSSGGSSGAGAAIGDPGFTGGSQGEPGPVGPQGPPGPTGGTSGGTTGLPSGLLSLFTAGHRTAIYGANGKIVAYVKTGTYQVIKVKVGGVWRYIIQSGPRKGQYFLAEPWYVIKPIVNSTTQTVSTVATSSVSAAPSTTDTNQFVSPSSARVAVATNPTPSVTTDTSNVESTTLGIPAVTNFARA